MWVKIDAFVAGEAFFAGYGSFGSFTQTYHLGTSGSTLFFSQWGSAVFGPSLQTGRWYHVAVTNVGNFVTLYLDGTVVNTGTLSINTPAGTQFYIGRIPGPLGDLRRLQGMVDEVEIFNRALSASEIATIFNAGSAGKCNIVIDIKPGSTPNSINPRSKGVIPVAILTTDTFDATTVDPTTVFGPTGTEAVPVQVALDDVDGDGDTDMILHFNTQDTGIQCGDTSASLTGETFSGQPITGADSIRTAGCHSR